VGATAAVVGLALTAAAIRDDPPADPPGNAIDAVQPTAPASAGTLRAPVRPASPASPVSPASPGSLVVINAPADGSDVRKCEVIEGTASLPPGTTLVLATRDLSAKTADDGAPRLSPVDGWKKPSSLNVWQADQDFGAASDSASADPDAPRRFRVEALVVDLDVLKGLMADARAAGDDWRRESLPDSTVAGASITMNRVPGACAAP
jgi:hypothetical protein